MAEGPDLRPTHCAVPTPCAIVNGEGDVIVANPSQWLRREMKKATSTIASFAIALGGFVAVSTVTAAPAQAACTYTNAYTHVIPELSDSFKIGKGNSCRDLNAKYTSSKTDKVRGWYLQKGTWRTGIRGFVQVPSAATYKSGQTVLIGGIKDGTTVRGEGYKYSQYVRYMH